MSIEAQSQLSAAILQDLWRAFDGQVPMDALLRRASWSQVQQVLQRLAQEGCRIERTPAGVRLAALGVASWQALLTAFGRHARVLPRATSTNDVAWQCAAARDAHGMVVLADEQTAGRGRFGHSWSSRAGQSVLMSVVLHRVDSGMLDRLTLLSGLAVARAIERVTMGAVGVEIKWPNDLLICGRKVAGVLVEHRLIQTQDAGTIHAAVIGMGINVCQVPDDFPSELRDRATSLYQAAGRLMDRLLVVSAALECLDAVLFLPPSDEAWLAEWKSRCALLGRRVCVRSGGLRLEGLVLDVAPLHGLVIRDDLGVTHFASARTASVAD